jgi:hypothetical protein
MALQRKGSFIRRIQNVTVSSTLAVAILSGGMVLQSCGSNQTSDYEEQQVNETVYSKGIKTYITETAPGQFKITDEMESPKGESMAIVRYYDGHRDTLNPMAAKALIDKQIQSNTSSIGGDNSLANALLFGGMGYMLANTMGNSYLGNFRNSTVVGKTTGKDTTRYRTRAGVGAVSRYYMTQGLFNRSQQLQTSVGSTKQTITKTVRRPASGRSGFFSRSRGSAHS